MTATIATAPSIERLFMIVDVGQAFQPDYAEPLSRQVGKPDLRTTNFGIPNGGLV
jgi:hypothetical protein